MNYFKRFQLIPKAEKHLLLETIILMFWIKFLLLVLPFRKVIRVNNGKRKRENRNPDPELLLQIKRALYRANRMSFWKNKCLVLSITGSWILKRRDIESRIYFGVKHEYNCEWVAHAWLNVEENEIVEKGGNYQEFILNHGSVKKA